MTRLIKSKKKLPPALEKEAMKTLLQVVSAVKSREDLISFFKEYFNESEKEIVLRRAAVAVLLKRKKSYRKIRDLLGISQSTVSNVRDILEHHGYGKSPRKKRVPHVRKDRRTRPLLGYYKGVRSII